LALQRILKALDSFEEKLTFSLKSNSEIIKYSRPPNSLYFNEPDFGTPTETYLQFTSWGLIEKLHLLELPNFTFDKNYICSKKKEQHKLHLKFRLVALDLGTSKQFQEQICIQQKPVSKLKVLFGIHRGTKCILHLWHNLSWGLWNNFSSDYNI